jgi:hypothetical protein
MGGESAGVVMSQQKEELNALVNMLWESIVDGIVSDWVCNNVRLALVAQLLESLAAVDACRLVHGVRGNGTSLPVAGLVTDVPGKTQVCGDTGIGGPVEDNLTLPEVNDTALNNMVAARLLPVGGMMQMVGAEPVEGWQQQVANWAGEEGLVTEGRAMVFHESSPGLLDGLIGRSGTHAGVDVDATASSGGAARWMWVPPEIMKQWCPTCDQWFNSKHFKRRHDGRRHIVAG